MKLPKKWIKFWLTQFYGRWNLKTSLKQQTVSVSSSNRRIIGGGESKYLRFRGLFRFHLFTKSHPNIEIWSLHFSQRFSNFCVAPSQLNINLWPDSMSQWNLALLFMQFQSFSTCAAHCDVLSPFHSLSIFLTRLCINFDCTIFVLCAGN